jgi:hypothetical protein
LKLAASAAIAVTAHQVAVELRWEVYAREPGPSTWRLVVRPLVDDAAAAQTGWPTCSLLGATAEAAATSHCATRRARPRSIVMKVKLTQNARRS